MLRVSNQHCFLFLFFCLYSISLYNSISIHKHVGLQIFTLCLNSPTYSENKHAWLIHVMTLLKAFKTELRHSYKTPGVPACGAEVCQVNSQQEIASTCQNHPNKLYNKMHCNLSVKLLSYKWLNSLTNLLTPDDVKLGEVWLRAVQTIIYQMMYSRNK